jgi:hypothetical protein
MWFRYIAMGLCSITATSLLAFQGIEFFNAFVDFFKNKY